MSLNQQVAATSLSPVETAGQDAFIKDSQPVPEISKQEAQQEAAQLKTEIQEIVNKDQVKAEANTSVAAAAQRRLEAGTFWSSIMKDPEGALQSEIEKAFPDDSAAAGIAKDLFNGLKSGTFDPQSSLAAYSNSDTLDARSGPATISGIAGMPTAAKSLLPSGKVTDGPTSFSRSMIMSTVTGVVRMATGFASDRLRAISAAHQTVASLGTVYPDLVSFLMTLPSASLSTLLTDKVSLLDQVISQTNSILKVVLSMTGKDYGYNHKAAINSARSELRSALSDLDDIERVLTSGGNFVSATWDRAEGDVEDAINILRDTKLDIQPGAKQMRLISLMSGINNTLQVLVCREDLIGQIYTNLSLYPSNFFQFGRYDNLFGSVIDQVQSLLNNVIQEMEVLLSRGVVSQFYIKEKKWYIELQGILQFMKGVKGLASRVSTSTSTQSFSDDLAENEDDLNNQADFSVLVDLVDAYTTAVRAAVFMPVNSTARIENLAASILSECERQKKSVSEIDQKLAGFKGSFGANLTEAVTVANGLVSFLESKDLIGMVQALKRGDIKGFFEAAKNEQTLEESALDRVVKLIRYSKSSAKSEVASLMETYTELRGRVRSDQLFRKLSNKASDLYIRDVKEKRIPANNRMLRGINRFNDTVKSVEEKAAIAEKRVAQVQSKIDQIVGKVGDGQRRAEAVVTKITQTKPVSCASR